MPKKIQSISDLIKASQGKKIDEESVQGKFAKKTTEIKNKDMENQTQQKAVNFDFPYFDLFGFPISPEALSLIDEKEAEKAKTVCFFYDGENVRLGTSKPDNPETEVILQELNEQYYTKGMIYLISKNSLNYALELYKNIPKVKPIIRGVEIKPEDLEKFQKDINNYKNLASKINKVNISDVVTLILATALKTDASDVHIEAEEEGIKIRLRIDGVLQDTAIIEKKRWKKVIARMKLLARVKINIEDKPQDGRYSIFLKEERVDVRSSFLPTNYGESVVMRLLRSGSIGLGFKALGIHENGYKLLEKEITKPNGMILTTGPTGSGKTTTLYSVLNELNQPETKIITLENPIEYQLEGINQSQVNDKKGYTFAKGLRSILRQDPDIVMVGEIRDLETAEIAIQASLTGHLVLSTLHTNDASGVIPRLINMGVKPYFITPSINAVIGQRLLRKLCPECKLEQTLTQIEEEKVKKILAVISPKADLDVPSVLPKIYQAGQGCEHCKGLGYKGREGIYEIFTMSDDIKQLTNDEVPAFKILQQAIENGMITMLQHGVLKVLDGLTSLEEVYRVIGKTDYIDELYDIVISKTLGRGVKLLEQEIQKGKELSADLSTMIDAIKEISSNDMINILLAMAIDSDVGDIHIEPTEDGVKVRFRIDGILHEIVKLPKDYYLSLLSKIKIFSGLPTNVKKASWDARFSILLKEEKMDCRVSIISGGYGETVVIRLLSSQAEALDMEKLGMKPYALQVVQKSMAKTKGVILTTGPTGSGKTTTLYSILNKLNKSDTKIITIEDPVEYHLEGIMQTQIDEAQGYTFPLAMRSLLRQNPNIMMIGEIRDAETAKVAIEASLTGHLVLSTIHANSASGAIARFQGLGIDRQIMASALECSIGQRLARKICPHCKEEFKPGKDALDEVRKILNEINPAQKQKLNLPNEMKFYQGKGCEKCSGLGYKGRIGLYEVIEMNPSMQKIIQTAGITDYEIEQEAVKNGAILIIQDGILKALEGETTIKEVFRVAK